MTEPLLGRSIDRLEDERFLRGRGRYVADLVAPNALHGVVVRSPHAHARIAAISVDAARQMPGVAAVLTGQELAADNIGPLPCAVTHIPMTTPLVVPPCHALARDIVRYVGEPVAFVVAESTEAARDAAEAVVVDYAPLPPVVSIADAVLPDAPSIWPEARGNIAFQFNRGEIGPVEAVIRDAAHVVECELVNNRVVAAPLETRGALGRVRCLERPSAPDRLGRRRARDPRPARRRCLSHRQGKTSRQHSRRRRRLRNEERSLSGMGAGAVGGAPPRPPGHLDRGSQRGFYRLRPWPRQPRSGPALRSTGMAVSSRSTPKSSPIWAPMSRRWRRPCRPWRWRARWAASTTFR